MRHDRIPEQGVTKEFFLLNIKLKHIQNEDKKKNRIGRRSKIPLESHFARQRRLSKSVWPVACEGQCYKAGVGCIFVNVCFRVEARFVAQVPGHDLSSGKKKIERGGVIGK